MWSAKARLWAQIACIYFLLDRKASYCIFASLHRYLANFDSCVAYVEAAIAWLVEATCDIFFFRLLNVQCEEYVNSFVVCVVYLFDQHFFYFV